MDHATAAATTLLESARQRELFPAAVAEVGDRAQALWRHTVGTLTLAPDAAAIVPGTLFDLASLTKPIATTTVALALMQSGLLRLDERVARLIPDWRGEDRAPVTLEHLLEHASGLSARVPGPPPEDRREFEHEICTMPLEYEPGLCSIYSDLGFILLGFCLESLAQRPLRTVVAAHLEGILSAVAGDRSARLVVDVPRNERAAVAPTYPLPADLRRGQVLRGEVHDNYAGALGGFAGHAGLFGNAAGVGAFARGVLRAWHGDPTLPAPLSRTLMHRAATKSGVPGSSRALGWDTMLPTSSCGARLSPSAFGHVGFTGTSLWIDPVHDRYYVLLTNRVCGGGSSDDMQSLRRAFHDTLADL